MSFIFSLVDNNVKFFFPKKEILEKLSKIFVYYKKQQIISLLKLALKENLFTLYYQPVIDIKKNKVISAESLIRIIIPEKKIIMPNDFIPIAENTCYIFDITKWIIGELQKRNQLLLSKLKQNIKLSFNIPPNQALLKNSIFKKVKKANNFEIEITERIFIDKDLNKIKQILTEIKNIGYSIALDDFGTNYSCFAYLDILPIDTLKIDRKFIQNIPNNKKTCLIVESLINLCKKLDIKIIAEGVETKEQADWLYNQGCNKMQGYYFSKPIPFDDFIDFVKKF